MAIFYHLCFTYLNVSTLVFRQKKKNPYMCLSIYSCMACIQNIPSHMFLEDMEKSECEVKNTTLGKYGRENG